MDAVTILREIWRCRVPVGLAAVVAILVGLALTYTVSLHPKSRKYEVGIASSRILVDTPSSQVVNVEPRGLETLGVRASVLANVMTEGEIKSIIATNAGLNPSELVAGVEFEGALPADLSRAAGNPEAHLLTARTPTDQDNVPLPIVEIEAQAPDSAAAVRLADAAVAGLGGYLASKAANESVPATRRLQVTGLGAPQVRQDIRGPKRVVALGLAVFVFLCGCAGILVLSALAPGWRLSALAPGRRLSALALKWRLSTLALGRRLSALALKWRRSALALGRRLSALALKWRRSALALGRRLSALALKWRRSALALGRRLSALAPGWRARLVAGRRRADAASKPTGDADASGAANIGERVGGGSGRDANGGGKDGSAVAGKNGAHGRDNSAEKRGLGQDVENPARGNGAQTNGRAPGTGKKGAWPRHSAPSKSGQGKRKNPNRRRRTARR